MTEPYRSEVETLRAECERLRDENTKLREHRRAHAVGPLLVGWLGVVLLNTVGGIATRSLLNSDRDRDVYLGATLAALLIGMTLWQIARTFRGVPHDKES